VRQDRDPVSARRRRGSLILAVSGIGSISSALIFNKHPYGFEYLAIGLIAFGYTAVLVLNWPRGEGRQGALGWDQRDDGDEGTASATRKWTRQASRRARFGPRRPG
jgi:hypothetical protein